MVTCDNEKKFPNNYWKKIALKNNLTELSMGMSGDFVSAINNGATYIRIGSAIFGARKQ